MAKRAKDPKNETGMVKVVDPFYDAPETIDAESHALPPPAPVASGPSFGQRVRRFFDVLLRLVAFLLILGILALGLYYGLPLLYQKYVVPVEQNTAGLSDLHSQQKQTAQQVAGLQTRLSAMETQQSQNAQALTDLDGRLDNVEAQIVAHTKSLAALEKMQKELQSQDQDVSAEVERQINVLKTMELLSRARLFMYQSNFGLARQDVKIARDLVADLQPDATDLFADDQEEVLRRLDLVLSALPNFPVAASDDLNVAWQILLLGLPQAGSGTSMQSTPPPTVTLTSTPEATFTPTPQAPVEATATQ